MPLANQVVTKTGTATPAAAIASQTNNFISAISAPPKMAPVVVESEIATTAFDNFAHWAEQFSQSSASVVEGERLAWKRREAMLELIQTDPQRAIELSAPFAWRKNLPPEVTKFFEEQLDGRGDFTVAVGTDFAQGSTTVLRKVQLGGKNYQAFVYGRRLTQSCKSAIPLHGIAMEGKMAVASEPLRRLTPAEAAALAKQRRRPLDPICGVSGQPATSRNQPVYRGKRRQPLLLLRDGSL